MRNTLFEDGADVRLARFAVARHTTGEHGSSFADRMRAKKPIR